MKPQNEVFESILNASSIDECSERVRIFLQNRKLENRDILRYAMMTEEILLKSLESNDNKIPFRLTMGFRFSAPFITLEVDGKPYNVYAQNNQEQGVLGAGILSNLGLSPEYIYAANTNRYHIRIKKKTFNPFISTLIALALAFAVGFAGLLLPDSFRSAVLTMAFVPLHNIFINILSCIAGPMIFLSVAWGIYGMGDAATLKQIGKKVLFNFIRSIFVAVVGFLIVSLFFFSFHLTVSKKINTEISTIVTMLLDIFPKNIFSPFVEGNILQIIFLAFVIGTAMLFLGQKTNAVAVAVKQINFMVQYMIEFIGKLVPYFIFVVIVKMIWSDSAAILLKVIKWFLAYISFVVVFTVIRFLYSSLKHRVSFFLLVKKGLPTLLVALTTASSAAAFGINMNVCKKQYGINDSICSFGLPLGIVAYKPATAICYLTMSLFFAENYQIKVSVMWFVILIIAAIILALATPPIPGGAMTAYTVLFTYLGIPVEAIAIALACDALVDFTSTGCDQFVLPLPLLDEASKMGLVDYNILRSKNQKR